MSLIKHVFARLFPPIWVDNAGIARSSKRDCDDWNRLYLEESEEDAYRLKCDKECRPPDLTVIRCIYGR